MNLKFRLIKARNVLRSGAGWRLALAIALNLGEKHECPKRSEIAGPFHTIPGPDIWEPVGEDRVCSYCGSMHPDDFDRFLNRVLNEYECRVEASSKPYKYYVHRPEIENASQGAIKFYAQHVPSEEWCDRVNPKIAEALAVSQTRWWTEHDARPTEVLK